MEMLQLDPARRISMKDALKHPYFSDLRTEDMDRYRR
jgi:serine/threonine protein kinase